MYLRSSLLQLILHPIHIYFSTLVLLLQFVVLRDTLISGIWFCKGFHTTIVVLNLPYPITAFLQLFIVKGYDIQHEKTVLQIVATPSKTFRLKVEVMPAISQYQSSNSLHYHIIVLECEFHRLFEKYVSVDLFDLQNTFQSF